MNVARSPYNVNALSQCLGTILLENAEKINQGKNLSLMAKEMEKELSSLMKGAKVFPTCANFVYIETAKARRIYDFLAHEGIAIRCMDDRHIRISVSVKEEMEQLYRAVRIFYEQEI